MVTLSPAPASYTSVINVFNTSVLSSISCNTSRILSSLIYPDNPSVHNRIRSTDYTGSVPLSTCKSSSTPTALVNKLR